MVTCWERADLLAILYAMFYCVFVTFPCVVLGKVWCLIVLILDLGILFYFNKGIIKYLVPAKCKLALCSGGFGFVCSKMVGFSWEREREREREKERERAAGFTLSVFQPSCGC